MAVLIDADNTAPKWAEAIFEEIATLGEASVRRIYGDFSGPHLRSWEKKLAGLALIPHQQFAYTTPNTRGNAEKTAPSIAMQIPTLRSSSIDRSAPSFSPTVTRYTLAMMAAALERCAAPSGVRTYAASRGGLRSGVTGTRRRAS